MNTPLTNLTISQFQRIYAIMMEDVRSDTDKQLGVVAIVDDIPIDQARQMTVLTLAAKYRSINDAWNKLPDMKWHRRFRCGGKWWYPTLFTDELTAGQMIDLMAIGATDEPTIVQNLHRIMATLCREGGWVTHWRKEYDGSKHQERADLFLEEATIGDVWGAAAFFLTTGERFFQATLGSLIESMTTQDLPPTSSPNTAG